MFPLLEMRYILAYNRLAQMARGEGSRWSRIPAKLQRSSKSRWTSGVCMQVARYFVTDDISGYIRQIHPTRNWDTCSDQGFGVRFHRSRNREGSGGANVHSYNVCRIGISCPSSAYPCASGPDEGQVARAKVLTDDLLEVVREEHGKVKVVVQQQQMELHQAQMQYAAYTAMAVCISHILLLSVPSSALASLAFAFARKLVARSSY
jgi:hypothetical protein